MTRKWRGRYQLLPKLTIRVARDEDAEAILQIHYAAVHEFGLRCYTQEILDEWSSEVNSIRIEKLRRTMIENPEGELWIVAESNEQIVGFGSIVPLNNELRACYVSPASTGKGVGQAILKELESQALKRGVDFLQADASLNAEGFYVRNGYSIASRGQHLLRSGRKMDCVLMRKYLS